MPRLGGWHRLWIVFSFLYLFLLPLMVSNFYPNAEEISAVDIYWQMRPESLHHLAHGSAPQGAPIVDIDHGHTLTFAVGTPEDKISEVASEYYMVLQLTLRKKRRRFFLGVFLVWLTSISAVYFLGWAARWIYRGFRAHW